MLYGKNISIKNNTSFSLVELMVVIAIIGILSAVAVPSYKNYVIRARIVEAISVGLSWKPKVMSYYDTNGNFPPSSGEFADVTNPSNYTSLLRWYASSPYRIEIWLRNVDPSVDGKEIWLAVSVANDIFTWQCGTHTADPYRVPLTSCDKLPSTCRYNCP